MDSPPPSDPVEDGNELDGTDVPAEPTNNDTKLRLYQEEMLEASLQRNVIVAMETGSGKTHIAIFRILAELERCDSSKLIWFMTPSVALSDQQHDAISQHLSGYLTKTLLGRDEIDKWTDQKLWDAALTNVRVVVGTPAVLADALSHGFVNISRLALLIFDEAHRCIKKGPMNIVMAQFYHPAKRQGRPVPHILGLTASPVMSANPGDLQNIETNLDAQAITPKDNRLELERYVHPAQVSVVVFNASVPNIASAPPLHAALNKIVESYDITADPRFHELQTSGEKDVLLKLENLTLKPKSRCYKQLKALLQRSNALWEQVGAMAADWYIQTCIERYLQSVVSDTLILPDLSETENKHLTTMFKSILDASPTSPQVQKPIHSQLTDKTRLLVMVLAKFASPSISCIIFVDQRAVVHALAHVLRQQHVIGAEISIGTFVGQSGIRKNSVADLKAYKDQDEDLIDFRNGKKNLIIATDVLQEGIDVTACNLVICFDAPKNLVSFVQRRGRARQENSKYIIFLDRNDYKSDPGRWQNLETQMKQTYMDDQRAFAEANAVDEPGTEKLRYHVESTGAVITLDSAKAHLSHFCASGTMQASRYIDLRPTFDVTTTGGGAKYTAHVQLPSFVHPDLRNARSSQSWGSWKTAVKDAALQAYVVLHKAGLLNDNLLPLVKDYAGPDESRIHLEQAAVVEITEKMSPWKMLFDKAGDESTFWHGAALSITCEREEMVAIVIWLPIPLPMPLSFPLYWNDDTRYIVDIRLTDLLVPSSDTIKVADMRQLTKVIFKSVYDKRMPTDVVDDFPILFSLPENAAVSCQPKLSNDQLPASTLLDEMGQAFESGIVRVKGQPGRKHIFAGISHHTATDAASDGPEIIVTTFPKRRDFLHRLPRHELTATAYTAKYTLPIANCTIDTLPMKYSLLAAFFPSILHRIEVTLIAQNLQQTILRDVKIKDLSLICEAMSSASSGEVQDYNRLEFLGDTVLKFCAVLQVTAQYPLWPEHYLTLEKFRLVTNNYLTQAALKIGLDKYILAKPFTGNKWRPAYVSELLATASDERREVSSKVLADVVEALIGAAYIDGGIEKSWEWISTILSEERWYPHPYAISLLVNDVQFTKHSNLDLLEQLIGHHFKNSALLIEAMTHVTFPNTGNGFSYERLEFLGDAVLDMVVVPHLFRHPRKLKDWRLEKIKSALVSSKFLSYCCMSYSIDEDRYDVEKQPKTKGQFEIKKSQRQIHLYDFLRCNGKVAQLKRQAVARFDKLRPAIDDALEHGTKYPWLELIALKPLKIISDLIESVLGAIYLDTKGDFARCEAFVEKIGLLRHMRRILDDDVQVAFPKEQLGLLARGQTVDYETTKREDEDGTKIFDCVVRVGGVEVAEVKGCNGAFEAAAEAASVAVGILEERRERTGSVSEMVGAGLEHAEEEADGSDPIDSSV